MARNPINVTRTLAKRLATGGVHKSEAEKELAAANAAEEQAKTLLENNSGWRFADKPGGKTALARIDAEVKALREKALAHHQRYRELTGQGRKDKRDPNAPKTGADKGKTGLRARTGLDVLDPKGDSLDPNNPARQAPKGDVFAPHSPITGKLIPQTLGSKIDKREGLAKLKLPAKPDTPDKPRSKYQQQGDQRKQLEVDTATALNKLPKLPRHPDADQAQTDHGTMGDQAKQARDQAARDRALNSEKSKAEGGKLKAKVEQKQAQKDLAQPKLPMKMDSKPGAGDRRTGSQSSLHALAVEQGWREKKTRNGWRLLSPDGKTTVAYHHTPSDRRALANMQAELVRGGLVIPGRRRGDLKVDTSIGPVHDGPKPPLPPTGPGQFDQDTRDRNPIPPDPRKGPGGTIVAVHPGPGGIVLPKPKLPPTGPGSLDQDTSDRTGLNRPGNGTIIAKSDSSGDKPKSGGPKGDRTVWKQGEATWRARNAERKLIAPDGQQKAKRPLNRTVVSSPTPSRQKSVEPHTPHKFVLPAPKVDQEALRAKIAAEKASETAAIIAKGQRDPNASDGLTKRDGTPKTIGRRK